MDDKIKKACEGKMASQGGMNLPEIKLMAQSMGHTASGASREELLKVICASIGMPVRQKKEKKQLKQKKQVSQVAQTKQLKQASQKKEPQSHLPKMPRGAVKQHTEAWMTRKPKTTRDREDLYEACGTKCFLQPKVLKYPVCAKDNTCKIDCDGVRAAYDVTFILHNNKRINPESRAMAADSKIKARDLGLAHCGWN
jgi:hypothetical protein